MEFEAACNLFSRYGITLTDVQFGKLSAYAEMLRQEGKKQNVTAVDDPDVVWVRHFLDSAYLSDRIPAGAAVLDLGTGGGIPGLPLAILRSDLNITLLDSELKKIEFCRAAAKQLSLDVNTVSGRAEELAHDPAFREQFDCAVSRAMASGSMLTELALPFVRPGGKLLAMKGRGYTAENEPFDGAAAALLAEKPEILSYDLEGEQKFLITVRKQCSTPQNYPRRFAKIKRDPL